MGRLVDPKPRGETVMGSGDALKLGKDDAERIAKYIPAEIISAYLAAISLIESGTAEDSDLQIGLLGASVVFGTIFTPLYLNRFAEQGKPKRMHLGVGTAAFLAWSYALKGFWESIGVFSSLAAGLLLIVFTLITGLLQPKEGDQ